jgi:hypothetical protein
MVSEESKSSGAHSQKYHEVRYPKRSLTRDKTAPNLRTANLDMDEDTDMAAEES